MSDLLSYEKNKKVISRLPIKFSKNAVKKISYIWLCRASDGLQYPIFNSFNHTVVRRTTKTILISFVLKAIIMDLVR